MERIIIKNLEELDKLTKEIAENIKGNEIILLEGDLGAGKTTFTKYLLKNLGVDEDITSPTFTVMNQYESPNFDIYHIDMYRVNDIDVSDLIGNGLIIIEWPKFEVRCDDCKIIKIKIEPLEDDSRIFEISQSDCL
jgi:tRNA threonylcarbamoyladenosine biosynthesis protein TsaE